MLDVDVAHPMLPLEAGGMLQVAFHGDDLFLKEANCSERTPWHHDSSLPFSLASSGNRLINIWGAVDAVPQLTSLRLLHGSHLWGSQPPAALEQRFGSQWYATSGHVTHGRSGVLDFPM